jgi:uncharacterized protein YjbJ (UPF0337 family)
MNKEELKGKARNLKGRAKEAIGSLTGNKKLQAEGTAERAFGAGEEKVGQAEQKLDDALKADAKRADAEEAEERAEERAEEALGAPPNEDPYPTTHRH